jgi:hypothetical protein
MSRETLKEFLARIGISADSISYGNISDENASGDVDRGDDLGIDPNTGKQLIQLSEGDKGLLGDYVSYISNNYRGGNTYGILGGNKEAVDNNRGSTIQAAEASNDSEVFAKQSTTLGDTLGNYSTSGIFVGLDTLIDKTAFDEDHDGHSLLKISGEKIDNTGQIDPQHLDSTASDHENNLKNLTLTMLQKNNRFAPGTGGIQYSKSRTETKDKIDEKDIAKSQNSFGENNNNGDSFIQEKLKSIGPSMLLKAAGLDVDTMDPDKFEGKNFDDYIQTSVISRELEAGNAYNSPVDRNERGAFDNSSAQQTTTTYNVPGLEFSGENTLLNENILTSFNELLSNVLADDAEFERKNESIYTTNNYYDSVERFLEVTIRNKELTNEDKAYFASMSRSLLRTEAGVVRDEKIRKFLDVFAVLGDTDLLLFTTTLKDDGKIVVTDNERFWDVDQLKDGPATRVSKSRSKNGFSTKSLAWRASSMPSMYHMPMSILRSVQRSGNISKKNPVKAMVGSSLGEKTYLAQNLESTNDIKSNIKEAFDTVTGNSEIDTTRNRIPKAMVDIYEDMLDAEYVPFYFHDLRTNEIVAFHAFLTSLSDSFTANHTSYEGYGRMDDVLIYKNTKRTISGKFTLAATSKEDFDEMWYKVNKLVEMLYPQWSKGELLEVPNSDTVFERPFSQIPAVSPMIRLRIGDVIRGNYSRFNLGRLFGSGNVETYINAESVSAASPLSYAASIGGTSNSVNAVTNTLNELAIQTFMIAFGSPLQLVDLIPGEIFGNSALGGEAKRLAYQILSQHLHNGFVNPLVLTGIDKLKNPDIDPNYGPDVGNIVLIKPTLGKFIHSAEDGIDEHVAIDTFLKGKIEKIDIDVEYDKTYYNVTILEQFSDLNGKIFKVFHEDIIVDPDFMFENYFAWFLDPVNNAMDLLLQDLANDLAAKTGLIGDSIDIFTTTFEDFMSPYNNSITKSFEESAGRGLAGFIGKLNYDLIGEKINWEIDHGSRAPMLLEISFDFKPVHDIAPGLDSDGFSRAPVYNVGSIMNNISGDQQGEGTSSKNRYNLAANDSVKKQK